MITTLTFVFRFCRETKIHDRIRTSVRLKTTTIGVPMQCQATQRWHQGPNTKAVSASNFSSQSVTIITLAFLFFISARKTTCVYVCFLLLARALEIGTNSIDRKPANEPSSPASVSIPYNNSSYAQSGSKVTQSKENIYSNIPQKDRNGKV